MVVCKFFLQGNCRNGDNCRFEHPQSRNASFPNQNRFAALANRAGSNEVRKDTNWNINITDVRNDFTDGKGRPRWILSTYGPGRNAPGSLLEGNEYSPEEMRLRFYEQASKGNEAQADQEAIQLWTNCEQAMKDIANNADNVIKFMEVSEKRHPNRIDLCKSDGTASVEQAAQSLQTPNPLRANSGSTFGSATGFGQSSAPNNPFAKPAAASFGQQSATPAFGSSGFGQTSQPSGFGEAAFGKPAFGSTGFGQSSTFGQPAQPGGAFGQAPQSTFGQPAQPTGGIGQTSQSAFGQPAQLSGFGSSGFGQGAAKNPFAAPSAANGFGGITAKNSFAAPSAASGFGQATGNSVFGQPAAPSSTFGQPQGPSSFGQAQSASAFGQQTQSASAFGQPQNKSDASQNTPPFGGTSSFGQQGGFGQPAFGQSSQPTSTAFGQPTQSQSNAFGQPTSSAFGGTSSAGFAGTSTPNNPFGQPTKTDASNPFGAKNDTGAAGFGQLANSETSNPFGVKSDAGSGAFGQPSQTSSAFGQASQQRSGSSTPNPFAQPVPTAPSAPSSTSVGLKATSVTPGQPHPLTQRPTHPLHYTQTLADTLPKLDGSKRLTSYRGRRVQYINGNPCYERPDRKGWERIWFPQGAAGADVVALNNPEKLNEIQGKEADYTDAVKEEYKFLFEEGRFREGKMPLVPPMREWCLYDF